jgi:hypothetical protein
MRPALRRWMPVLVVAVVGALLIGGLALYRHHLGKRLAELEKEEARLRALLEDTRAEELALLQPSCPPVAELDPGWARYQPWGPAGPEALPLLEGGEAEVRLAEPDADPAAGARLAWNGELRVYEVPTAEIPHPDRFHLAVRLPDGRWARTLPSNWPLPACAPWLDCSRGGCEQECLPRSFREKGGPLPGAAYPEHCREQEPG